MLRTVHFVASKYFRIKYLSSFFSLLAEVTLKGSRKDNLSDLSLSFQHFIFIVGPTWPQH